MKHRVTKEKLDLIQMLLDEGQSYRDIEQKIGVPKTIIHRWMTIFAENKPDKDMPEEPKQKTAPRRVVGRQAPIESELTVHTETAEEKIARLEKELENERLKVELFKEIINVSEKRYGINLLKKAGTKQ